MTWKNLDDNLLDDEPRKLTDAEIKYVTDRLPLPLTPDKESADLCRDGIVEELVRQLKKIELCPSAIKELTDRVVEQHIKSLIAPGTPIGIIATEAVGSTTTQMTLNTFHTSGSSKSASFGIEAMRDLIFARKNIRNEITTIYFTDKSMSYEDVLNTRKYIVGSMISDFVKDYTIKPPNNLEKYDWYNLAKIVLGKDLPKSKYVLRLFLDIKEMYKHGVTVGNIAKILESSPQTLVAIHGGTADGILDLYPITGAIKEVFNKNNKHISLSEELIDITYLESFVLPDLSNIRVKGIPGIKSLTPIVSHVWSAVITEKKLSEDDLTDDIERDKLLNLIGKAWVIFYNSDVLKTTGLKPENIAALCKNAGYGIVTGSSKYLIIVGPDDRFKYNDQTAYLLDDNNYYVKVDNYITIDDQIFETTTKNLDEYGVINYNNNNYIQIESNTRIIGDIMYKQITNSSSIKEVPPGEYIQEKVAKEKERIREEIKKEKRVINPSRLISSSEFVVAETEGSNLKEILALPGVDKQRTTCNNLFTIASALGIEAARTFLIRALTTTISNNGSYVNPAHILFISEFITNRGEPYGATYTGISRQPGGHLSLATLERAGKVFSQNALHGRKEDVRNVSAAITLGARIAVGSGYFDIGQEIITETGQRDVINDSMFTALKNTNNTDLPFEEMDETYVDNRVDNIADDNDVDMLSLFGGQNVISETRVVDDRDLDLLSTKINVYDTIKIEKPIAEEQPELFVFPDPVPIVSAGLVSDNPFADDIKIKYDYPSFLRELNEPSETLVVPMPEEEIPLDIELPDLDFEGLEAGTYARRKQIEGLEQIDINELLRVVSDQQNPTAE